MDGVMVKGRSTQNGQLQGRSVLLFKIYCRACKVIDHIIPPPPPAASLSLLKDTTPKVVDPKTWYPLNATILQWICGTNPNKLMHTILEPDTTAAKEWARLKDILQDNKNLDAFRLILQRWCPRLQSRLVLQLIDGLNESYDNVARFIQQTDPLPPFYEAISLLVLEETRKSKQVANATALWNRSHLVHLASLIKPQTPKHIQLTEASNHGLVDTTTGTD
uniref:Hybrid signal transduction histidine kinase M n=1 Tax=Tanacetum cinerariifolium TaxID=118510 RepID=A0A6L2N1V6_TANCI|nr:hypothetical protein [Tanacetum cinerariifolium]